jgi:AraC-like DNA-binding protein/mannose-6-phosphate isomerase-like protein (cupin superfamily)
MVKSCQRPDPDREAPLPILNNALPFEWEEPDDIPRPVVTIGASGFDMAGNDAPDPRMSDRREADFHHHAKGQFLLWMKGLLTCEVAGGFWIVPPGSGIWVPAGVEHRMQATGRIACYVVFVAPEASRALPAQCCTLSTTPLLRELVARSAEFPWRYEEGGMASRLMTLLLDELALARMGRLYLPMPADARLRRLVDLIVANPMERGSISSWAKRFDLGARTLSRLVVQETGMSFGRWRRQLHLMLAIQWLTKGASVRDVADGLGYENASSFVLMFRKALGETPGRYLDT